MGGSRRHIGAGLATGMAIMLAGAALFHDSNEAAMQAIGLLGFFSVFAVFHFLDERAKRLKKKRPQ